MAHFRHQSQHRPTGGIAYARTVTRLIHCWPVDYDYDGQGMISSCLTCRTRRDGSFYSACRADLGGVGHETVTEVVAMFGNDANHRARVEA